MHKIYKAIQLAILFALAAASATAADPIGQVIALEGKATLTGKDGTATPLAIKSPVALGDKIVTGPGAKVQIMFIDDSVVAQGEQSEMTIDEYMFTPSSKSDNKCTLNFAKGLFRAVTGKITELNPERFKVRTRLATIGIRGCDIGFRIEHESEHVYVIVLPDNHRLFIETTAQLAQGMMTAQQVVETLEVLSPGTVIRIETTGATSDRTITVDDARALILGTTPHLQASTGNQSGSQMPGTTGDTLPNTLLDTDSEGGGTGAAGDGTVTGTSDGDNTMETTSDALVEDVTATDSIDIPTTTDSDSTGNGTTIANYQETIASGLDWSWGVWKDPNGTIYDIYVTGNFLDAASVQSIVSGSVSYNLSGNGSAGALLTQSGARSYLQGSCAMQVTIGGGITPAWSGQYSLQNTTAGDSLIFNANGGINSDGLLSGSAYYYNLNGVFYDPNGFQRNDVSGHLTGPGTTTPISGTAGTFNFIHNGGNTSVQGVYGANLAPTQ